MRYEIGLTILPEALGKRLDAYILSKHPFAVRKNELRRQFILEATVEKLDREEQGNTEKEWSHLAHEAMKQKNDEKRKGYKDPEEAIQLS